MPRLSRSVVVIVLGARCGLSQTPPPTAFEVASIKSEPAQDPARASSRMSIDGSILSYSTVSLSDVLGQAFGFPRLRIIGPDWVARDRFDITAKIPVGAGKAQVPQMLQSLLSERFMLMWHKETRELPAFVLTVGKNGAKFEKAETPGNFSAGITQGRAHMKAQTTMATFVEYLSTRLGRTVQDQTGLEGAYILSLQWMLDLGPSAAPVPAIDPSATVPAGPSIFTALDEQLGLKLTAKNLPLEVLVIDHLERVPTEN